MPSPMDTGLTNVDIDQVSNSGSSRSLYISGCVDTTESGDDTSGRESSFSIRQEPNILPSGEKVVISIDGLCKRLSSRGRYITKASLIIEVDASEVFYDCLYRALKSGGMIGISGTELTCSSHYFSVLDFKIPGGFRFLKSSWNIRCT